MKEGRESNREVRRKLVCEVRRGKVEVGEVEKVNGGEIFSGAGKQAKGGELYEGEI